MTQAHDQDVVDLLTAQHREIEAMLDRLRAGDGDAERVFADLVRILAAHETAEEEVVHPLAGRSHFGAEGIVEPRLREEKEAKRALAELCDLGVGHADFRRKLEPFAAAVAAHAAHEEAEEFVLLRRQYSSRELRNMAGSVRAAEALAPTRPHPRTGASALLNMLAGPPLAILDRLRDLVAKPGHR